MYFILEENLRIVLCTEGYFPILNGVVTFVDMLAKECTRQGHQVLIVTSDHTAKKNYIQDGVLRCPARKSEQFLIDLSVPLDYARYALVRAFKPDVIHIQAEWGISLFGLQTAKLLRIPLVYTLHTEYSKFLTYAVRPAMIPLAAAILARLERYIAKRATIITSPSRKGQDYFHSIGVDLEVEVIHNSVDLDGFDPSLFSSEDKHGLRASLGIKPDEMCVLFVGRMGPEKSVDVLLDYWARTIRPEHKLRLLLIGGGPDDQKFRGQSKALGLDSQVVFCGKIPHANIGLYYAICDAYVTASVSEMHSVAMLEGLGSGLPVLQRLDKMNVGQLHEGVNGYLYETADDFGRLLLALRAKTPQELSEIKQRVRLSVLNTNSPKALADKYLIQYNKAIDRYLEQRGVLFDEYA